MSTIVYYATPAQIESSFENTGEFEENIGASSGTLSYGNLLIRIAGTHLNQSSGTLKSFKLYIDGDEKLSASGFSLNIQGVADADNPYAYVTDRIFGGPDSITGSKYADTLRGLGGNDTIRGLAANDTLLGGNGYDRLIGGNGSDKLTGGPGNDFFIYNNVAESGASVRDVVQDFQRGNDKLDLSGIDANVKASGNNPFTKLIHTGDAFTAAGQLRFAGGILYGNTDADATAEFSVKLTGISTLWLSDILE